MEIRKSSSIWLRHTKIIPPKQHRFTDGCISGRLGSEQGPSLTLNHRRSPHISCVTPKMTLAGFNTAWICLLANRKLSKSVAHGWLDLLGGPKEKSVLRAPCWPYESHILIDTGCFVSIACSGTDAPVGPGSV